MKIEVNKDLCTGCGMCVSIDSDIFEFDADGKSSVKMDEIPEEKRQAAMEAIESCPVGAISEVTEEMASEPAVDNPDPLSEPVSGPEELAA